MEKSEKPTRDLSDEACARRLRTALDLADSGIQMRRAQLRRQYPDASEAEIDERLGRWLRHRPGAEHGDAEGRVIPASEYLDS